LAGGLLIGAAATLLLWLNGRIAGVSGILGGALSPQRGEVGWRATFLAGLIAGGARAGSFTGEPWPRVDAFPQASDPCPQECS